MKTNGRIELRSDTLTQPCAAMRAAMAAAEVGDDGYGEDPTVNRLEATAAERLGKDAAIFVSSGTMSNLLALFAHCRRGEAYICGREAHIYRVEDGGPVIGGFAPCTVDFEQNGTISTQTLDTALETYWTPAPLKLLCLENTFGGRVLPMDYLKAIRPVAQSRGLALHVDGARIFSAAVALNVPVSEVAAPFDTISFCLSKNLGAPVGSVLAGPKDLIERARRWRLTIGGQTRQAGILAAAGLYALDHNVERLRDDHANAQKLAKGLNAIPGLSIDLEQVHTNMVFVDIPESDSRPLGAFLSERGINVMPEKTYIRLVVHKDVDEKDIDAVLRAFEDFYAG